MLGKMSERFCNQSWLRVCKVDELFTCKRLIERRHNHSQQSTLNSDRKLDWWNERSNNWANRESSSCASRRT